MVLTKKHIKIISLVVDLLLALVSIFMVIVGIDILLREPKDVLEKISKNNRNVMAVLNIIPSAFNITITLYFGIHGAIHQKFQKLFTCVKWLSVVVSWTFFFAIYCFFLLSNTEVTIKKDLTRVFGNYNVALVRDTTDTCHSLKTIPANNSEIDDIQHEFQCCGVDGPNYWITRNLTKPMQSCYENFEQNDLCVQWPDGCVKKMTEKNYGDIRYETINMFVYILAFEIVVIIILLYLAFELKEMDRRMLKRQQIENGII